MPPKAKGKKGKKGDDEDFWYISVSELYCCVYKVF
jgi:hypothetical protein